MKRNLQCLEDLLEKHIVIRYKDSMAIGKVTYHLGQNYPSLTFTIGCVDMIAIDSALSSCNLSHLREEMMDQRCDCQ